MAPYSDYLVLAEHIQFDPLTDQGLTTYQPTALSLTSPQEMQLETDIPFY